MRIHVPWSLRKLSSDVVSGCHFLVNHWCNTLGNQGRDGKLRILFSVPFYGYTGGSFAVISAANLLSEVYDVSFLTTSSNIMNRYVSTGVRVVSTVAERYDFYVVESGIDDALIAEIKRGGGRIILTMHGAPPTVDGTKNHGYSDGRVAGTMIMADSVQYVSDVQLPFFGPFPTIHRRKIPNYVLRTNKSTKTQAIGVVCDTTLPHKNVDSCIKAAELSNAKRIEIWGKYEGRCNTELIRWNGFTSNKQRIYNSFDVLVHLSRLENQPLVILEALSAGIPCVLADLPAYVHLRGLNGVVFVDPDDRAAAVRAINKALSCSEEDRRGLIRFWEEHHSPRAILAVWGRYLKEVSELGAIGV
jgi:glycosyltransferase involved in cell wall biosynthesis